MKLPRRVFLHQLTGCAALVAAAAGGLLRTASAWAADWNAQAFTAKNLQDALARAGYANPVDSTDIVLKVPEIAEDGSVVPVEATSNIPGTTSMAIFVADNPNPLIAEFSFLNGGQPFFSTRIKMAKTSTVRVAAKAGDKVYITGKAIKVTAGGCGG